MSLNNLPRSNDKFWKHAETNSHTIQDRPKCDHYFVLRDGRSAECKRCKIGYYMTPGFEVKKGHIYVHGSLVI